MNLSEFTSIFSERGIDVSSTFSSFSSDPLYELRLFNVGSLAKIYESESSLEEIFIFQVVRRKLSQRTFTRAFQRSVVRASWFKENQSQALEKQKKIFDFLSSLGEGYIAKIMLSMDNICLEYFDTLEELVDSLNRF